MKKLFLIILMIFIFGIQIVHAVPAAPNCAQVKAKVLNIKEARADNPYEGPTLELEVVNVEPCPGMFSWVKDDEKFIKAITWPSDTTAAKLKKSDVISVKIECNGDEHGHGYYASETQILEPAHQ